MPSAYGIMGLYYQVGVAKAIIGRGIGFALVWGIVLTFESGLSIAALVEKPEWQGAIFMLTSLIRTILMFVACRKLRNLYVTEGDYLNMGLYICCFTCLSGVAYIIFLIFVGFKHKTTTSSILVLFVVLDIGLTCMYFFSFCRLKYAKDFEENDPEAIADKRMDNLMAKKGKEDYLRKAGRDQTEQ